MLRRSLLSALFAGVTLFLILNLIWGSQGIKALENLRSEREKLEANRDLLAEENRDGQLRLDRLSRDRYSITLLARRLGYIQRGEDLVITDLGSSALFDSYRLPVIHTGSAEEFKDRRGFFRLISAVTGLAVFLLSLIREWGERGIRR